MHIPKICSRRPLTSCFMGALLRTAQGRLRVAHRNQIKNKLSRWPTAAQSSWEPSRTKTDRHHDEAQRLGIHWPCSAVCSAREIAPQPSPRTRASAELASTVLFTVTSAGECRLPSGPYSCTAEAGVEDVAEGVAQHVEAEDGERDRRAGEDGHPGRTLHVG